MMDDDDGDDDDDDEDDDDDDAPPLGVLPQGAGTPPYLVQRQGGVSLAVDDDGRWR